MIIAFLGSRFVLSMLMGSSVGKYPFEYDCEQSRIESCSDELFGDEGDDDDDDEEGEEEDDGDDNV